MSSYDRARRQQVDPNKVRWANTPVNKRAVDEYRRNPNKRSTDGDPFIVIDKRGVAHGWNGKHRGQAAQLEGRKFDGPCARRAHGGPSAGRRMPGFDVVRGRVGGSGWEATVMAKSLWVVLAVAIELAFVLLFVVALSYVIASWEW